MPAPGSPLHVNQIRNVTVVTFRDRILLDTEELKVIEQELLNIVGDRRDFRLVIDFNHVNALSSQMLGTLLKLQEQLSTADGRMALCHLSDNIRAAFEITALKKVFKICGTQAAAVTAVA